VQELSPQAKAAQARLLGRYMASLPEKRARIEGLFAQLESRDWDVDAMAALKAEVHRLAGSAGSYGLEALGTAAVVLEGSLKSVPTSTQGYDEIRRQLALLLQALDIARNEKA